MKPPIPPHHTESADRSVATRSGRHGGRNEGSLAGLRFALAGAGKVGSSLSHWLLASGAEMVSVLGRVPGQGGRRLAAELGVPFGSLGPLAEHGTAFRSVCAEAPDLLLITVSDDALESVAQNLAEGIRPRVALHCSGSRGAEVLEALRETGSAIGSWHPLRAFPAVLDDPALGRGTWFAVDGDDEARQLAQRLSAALGATSFELASEDRPLYHLAATLAAGGVATLMALVEELLLRRGLPRDLMSGYLALARGALDQVEGQDAAPRAITGPVARGEERTMATHRRALEEVAPELLPFVDALAAATRRQIARRDGGLTGRHDGSSVDPSERADTADPRDSGQPTSGPGIDAR